MGGIAQNTGSTMGGGLPSNPMGSRFGRNLNMPQGQSGMPQKPMFGGMGQPIPGMYPGMGYPAPQVSPPQGGFPQQAQGMPMQGSPFGNVKPYVSSMGQQPQVSPMQSQLTPDMLNNMKMKLQGMGLPANQGQAQAPTPYSRTANYEGTGGLLKTIRGY